MSGERLQDHWSSGFAGEYFFFMSGMAQYTRMFI